MLLDTFKAQAHYYITHCISVKYFKTPDKAIKQIGIL